MKRTTKIALALFALGVIVFLSTTAYVINELPSPSSLARAINTPSPAPVAVGTTVSQKTPIVPESLPETELPPTSQATLKMGFNELIDADPTDIQVCENLGTGTEFIDDELSFESFLKPEARQNPMIESFRLPLVTLFQDEQFSGLIRDLTSEDHENASREEKDSFLEKVNFYARATRTVAHMYGRKKDFETLGDRATHLTVLARLALRRPELVGTPALMDLCDRVQGSMVRGEKIDVKAERADLLKLIAEQGIRPSDLQFHPTEFMKFKASLSGNQLSFTMSDKVDESAKQ